MHWCRTRQRVAASNRLVPGDVPFFRGFTQAPGGVVPLNARRASFDVFQTYDEEWLTDEFARADNLSILEQLTQPAATA